MRRKMEEKTDWNEKLGVSERIWIEIEKINQPSEGLKIITDKKGKTRKLAMEDFTPEEWESIRKNGKIFLPIERVAGKVRVFPPEFPKALSLEYLYPGDMAFWCEGCNFCHIATFQDEPLVQIKEMFDKHDKNSFGCDGIATRKIHVYNHETMENKEAVSLLAAMAKTRMLI